MVGAGFTGVPDRREEALDAVKSFAGKLRSHSLGSSANVRFAPEIVGAGFIREEGLKGGESFAGKLRSHRLSCIPSSK